MSRAAVPKIPDYELIRPLGEGTFGIVWLGRSRTGIHRAVKILRLDPSGRIEFEGLRAYEVAARTHPNLVAVHHVGESEGVPYYVMELADGIPTAPTFSPQDYKPHDVAWDLRHNGSYPLDEALSIAIGVLGGLQHLHSRGVRHRDVKPSNIVFVQGVPKLADVGLVTESYDSKESCGTLAYVPPEGVRDESGDLYCLGKCLYEMVTGLSPILFPEYPRDWEDSRRSAIAPLTRVLDRACAPDPEHRFRRGKDMLAALRDLAPDRKRTFDRWQWWFAAAAAVALMVAYAGFAGLEGKIDAAPNAVETISSSTRPLVAELDLRTKPDKDADYEVRVRFRALPLRIGNHVQFRATFTRPCYPIVLSVSNGTQNGVQIKYPPDSPTPPKPVTELILPPSSDTRKPTWWPLTSPIGTQAFILLASSKPIVDRIAIRDAVASLGKLPALSICIELDLKGGAGNSNPLALQDDDRGLGEPVMSDPTYFERLHHLFEGRFEAIQAVAFPIVAGAEQTPPK